MQIGILGSGDVGRRLGEGCLRYGHHVMIGTRNPEKKELREWMDNLKISEKPFVGSFEEAASFGELIVISTLWEGTRNAINLAGSTNFEGKIVIDTTNPLDFSKGMPPQLSIGYDNSAGEVIQSLLSNSNVVKAFNIVGNPHMVNPNFQGGPPTMFICGNSEDAKNTVIEKLLTPFGWEAIDIGGIQYSRLLEPLAMLWITYYFKTGTGNHAFKLLRHIKESESN